ncbi:AzlD domain-containing protein [Aquisalimonas asiatica]|uniref:Branched-chain amino acid transport protein n=1 Tax=Aquisalimonas asiatica TaxID=406100 RepID=A0A1H8Q432_9GAMM|nr:AzlD domain-containing protein [Aquisalimonas asiatica]SEO48533.1 Branched-chain amino acid transport protein [Aquisalimonas asiatica]
MSALTIWTMIAVIGVGTFLLRISGLQLLGQGSMPDWLARTLRYVPAAVIAAIVIPAMVHGGPSPGFNLENTRLLAGLIAAVVAWTTRSVLATLGIGMTSLWALEWFAGNLP